MDGGLTEGYSVQGFTHLKFLELKVPNLVQDRVTAIDQAEDTSESILSAAEVLFKHFLHRKRASFFGEF